MVTTSDRSKAQIAAEKRNDLKRKNSDRLPGARLSEEESNTMNRLYALFDSKKDAILAATELYLKKNE